MTGEVYRWEHPVRDAHAHRGSRDGSVIAVRYLFMIPLLLVAAALTLLPSWRRWWQVEEIGVILLTVYTDELQEMPFDFGYVRMVDGRARGPTPARFLLGRS